jgi:hypothetical protein
VHQGRQQGPADLDALDAARAAALIVFCRGWVRTCHKAVLDPNCLGFSAASRLNSLLPN